MMYVDFETEAEREEREAAEVGRERLTESQWVALTDAVAEEIGGEVCHPDPWSAAGALCGCWS